MIVVTTVNRVLSYPPYCHVCQKRIILTAPFSRAKEIVYTDRMHLYSTKYYTHEGKCETMAVLQLSNEP